MCGLLVIHRKEMPLFSLICLRSSVLKPKGVASLLVQSRGVASGGKTGGKLVILGTGWAGLKCLSGIDTKNYEVVVISPRNHFIFTPLLASTAGDTLVVV